MRGVNNSLSPRQFLEDRVMPGLRHRVVVNGDAVVTNESQQHCGWWHRNMPFETDLDLKGFQSWDVKGGRYLLRLLQCLIRIGQKCLMSFRRSILLRGNIGNMKVIFHGFAFYRIGREMLSTLSEAEVITDTHHSTAALHRDDGARARARPAPAGRGTMLWTAERPIRVRARTQVHS